MRCSVYIVCPSVFSCNNLKPHQTLEVKNIFKQENLMLQLTFNPGLTLTGLRTTSPSSLVRAYKHFMQKMFQSHPVGRDIWYVNFTLQWGLLTIYFEKCQWPLGMPALPPLGEDIDRCMKDKLLFIMPRFHVPSTHPWIMNVAIKKKWTLNILLPIVYFGFWKKINHRFSRVFMFWMARMENKR